MYVDAISHEYKTINHYITSFVLLLVVYWWIHYLSISINHCYIYIHVQIFHFKIFLFNFNCYSCFLLSSPQFPFYFKSNQWLINDNHGFTAKMRPTSRTTNFMNLLAKFNLHKWISTIHAWDCLLQASTHRYQLPFPIAGFESLVSNSDCWFRMYDTFPRAKTPLHCLDPVLFSSDYRLAQQ